MTVKADAVTIMPMMIDHLGEPLADNSVMPTYYVSQFARTGVTVALTGDGGDEVFAGYRRFYQIRRLEWLSQRGLLPLWRGLRRMTVALENRARPQKGRRRFPSTRPDEMLALDGLARYKHLLAFYSDSEKQSMLTPELRARIGHSATTEYLAERFERPGEDVLNRYLYLDLVTYLPEDILFKVDIASMANSLECRSPFLDHKMIEFAASLPGRYKLSRTAQAHPQGSLRRLAAAWLHGPAEEGILGAADALAEGGPCRHDARHAGVAKDALALVPAGGSRTLRRGARFRPRLAQHAALAVARARAVGGAFQGAGLTVCTRMQERRQEQ